MKSRKATHPLPAFPNPSGSAPPLGTGSHGNPTGCRAPVQGCYPQLFSWGPGGPGLYRDESIQSARRRPAEAWVSTQMPLRCSPADQLFPPALLCCLCQDILALSPLPYSWTSTAFPSPASLSRFSTGAPVAVRRECLAGPGRSRVRSRPPRHRTVPLPFRG